MKIIDKPFLVVGLYTTIFLLLFSGLYFCYEIFYSSYFNQSQYEWYGFVENGKMPSKIDIILNGFKSPINFLYSTEIAIVTSFLSKILTRKISDRRWINILYTTFAWTAILAFAYLVCQFILNKFIYNYTNQFSLELIRKPLPLLMILYFIFIAPMVYGLYNKIIPQ
jgi:hypothetical protein